MKVDLKTKSVRFSRQVFSRECKSVLYCRRAVPPRLSAVVTLGNTPNVDILCSNQQGTRFAHIQVKTFVPGNRTCSVGLKAMKNVGPSFFWVFGGIPLPESDRPFEYYVIPSRRWLTTSPKRTNFGYRRPAKQAKRTRTTRCARCIFRLTNLLAVGTFQSIATDGI